MQAQTYPCQQIFVVDGDELPDRTGIVGTWIKLPRNYADYGNTPRALGGLHAAACGFEAIAFLDDDNWMAPDHIASVLGKIRAEGADFGGSARMLHHLDGRPLLPCPDVDGVKNIDTNCLVLTSSAFDMLVAWAMTPVEQAAWGDLYLWRFGLKRGKRFVFTGRHTVAYRTRHLIHYELAGIEAPPGAVRRLNPSGDAYDRG